MPEGPEEKDRQPIGFQTGGTRRLTRGGSVEQKPVQEEKEAPGTPPDRLTGKYGLAGFRDTVLGDGADLELPPESPPEPSGVHEAPTAANEIPAPAAAAAAPAAETPRVDINNPDPDRFSDYETDYTTRYREGTLTPDFLVKYALTVLTANVSGSGARVGLEQTMAYFKGVKKPLNIRLPRVTFNNSDSQLAVYHIDPYTSQRVLKKVIGVNVWDRKIFVSFKRNGDPQCEPCFFDDVKSTLREEPISRWRKRHSERPYLTGVLEGGAVAAIGGAAGIAAGFNVAVASAVGAAGVIGSSVMSYFGMRERGELNAFTARKKLMQEEAAGEAALHKPEINPARQPLIRSLTAVFAAAAFAVVNGIRGPVPKSADEADKRGKAAAARQVSAEELATERAAADPFRTAGPALRPAPSPPSRTADEIVFEEPVIAEKAPAASAPPPQVVAQPRPQAAKETMPPPQPIALSQQGQKIVNYLEWLERQNAEKAASGKRTVLDDFGAAERNFVKSSLQNGHAQTLWGALYQATGNPTQIKHFLVSKMDPDQLRAKALSNGFDITNPEHFKRAKAILVKSPGFADLLGGEGLGGVNSFEDLKRLDVSKEKKGWLVNELCLTHIPASEITVLF